MRSAILSAMGALALAACGGGPEANNQAAAPKAETTNVAAPETDTQAAERLVRDRVGRRGELRFGQPQTGTRDGVSVVCGTFNQSGRDHRYIVVNRDDVFVESEMREGEMTRAMAEFCGDGERG